MSKVNRWGERACNGVLGGRFSGREGDSGGFGLCRQKTGERPKDTGEGSGKGMETGKRVQGQSGKDRGSGEDHRQGPGEDHRKAGGADRAKRNSEEAQGVTGARDTPRARCAEQGERA